MDGKGRLFQMETAGSLTPELEGAAVSGKHPARMSNTKKENNRLASEQPSKSPRPYPPAGEK